MEITEAQNIIGWLLGVLAVGIISIITGIYSIIRSGKLMPKELKGVDLDNRSKEVSIADQLDELATKAAEKTLKTQEKYDRLEELYCSLEIRVNEQDKVILNQNSLIGEQTNRLDIQEIKIREQDEEIFILKEELEGAKLYNETLIKQMQEAGVIPLPRPEIPSKLLRKKGVTNGK